MTVYSSDWIATKERAAVRRLLLQHGWEFYSIEGGEPVWQSPRKE